ncbi:triose-phosphate isomerase [Candidatus Woesearchaeota archaeon]|nr:triose-phosphate isomerase [Candidatus Woesearchaeota archaeon]
MAVSIFFNAYHTFSAAVLLEHVSQDDAVYIHLYKHYYISWNLDNHKKQEAQKMILINFKTYEQSTGNNAVALAKQCEEAAVEAGKKAIVVPQTVDIFRVKQACTLPIYAQHADEIDFGSHTGHMLIQGLKQAGAEGTIINHSENRISMEKIGMIIEKCKERDFKVLVCAQDPEEVGEISKLAPDYVAYEPPELIGGDISVSSAKPELITESVEKAGDIPLIVGAGVKNTEDVEIGKKLGAEGILVASGVVKAENPKEAVLQLMKGM